MSNDKKPRMLKGIKYIDLFAGIGGFHLAMDAFGAECVYASEWDKHAQKTYHENFGITPEGDITKVKAQDIPEHDIICAGFPCQAFSISGKQKGFKDIRGTLFFDVARIAKYHQPKLILMENVRNFKKHDNGRTFQTIEKTLDQIGYKLFHKVLNASHFGLPHSRERIFMVAVRKDIGLNEFHFPQPTHEEVSLKDILLPDDQTNQYEIVRNDMAVDRAKASLASSGGPFFKPVRVGTINKGGQGERIYSDVGHAITLSAEGGGPGSKTGCYLVNGKVRKLAPRECARLQGFPDTFKIPVSDSQAWKQFGNSVPVKILNHLLEAITQNTLLYKHLTMSPRQIGGKWYIEVYLDEQHPTVLLLTKNPIPDPVVFNTREEVMDYITNYTLYEG